MVNEKIRWRTGRQYWEGSKMCAGSFNCVQKDMSSRGKCVIDSVSGEASIDHSTLRTSVGVVGG